MAVADNLLCLFSPIANPPDGAAPHVNCSHYIAVLVKLLRLENEYRRSRGLRDQYRLMVNHLSEGALTLSTDGRVLSYNRSTVEILRMSGASQKGRLRMVLDDMILDEDGVTLSRAAWPSTLVARTGRTISNVVADVPAGNGQIVWLYELVLSIFPPDSVSPYTVLVIFTDIMATRSAYEQPRLSGTKDSLTGLPNHAASIERFDARSVLPSTGESALLYIGLDHLKTVNETARHHMDNQVPNMAVQRIRGQTG